MKRQQFQSFASATVERSLQRSLTNSVDEKNHHNVFSNCQIHSTLSELTYLHFQHLLPNFIASDIMNHKELVIVLSLNTITWRTIHFPYCKIVQNNFWDWYIDYLLGRITWVQFCWMYHPLAAHDHTRCSQSHGVKQCCWNITGLLQRLHQGHLPYLAKRKWMCSHTQNQSCDAYSTRAVYIHSLELKCMWTCAEQRSWRITNISEGKECFKKYA